MSRSSRRKDAPPPSEPRLETVVRQARRARIKGDHRRAMVLLREACCLVPEDARLWTLYATACVRQRRTADAERALSQAVWLRERQGDDVRAAVTRRLLERARAASGAWLRRAA